jgi:hypothetical protein
MRFLRSYLECGTSYLQAIVFFSALFVLNSIAQGNGVSPEGFIPQDCHPADNSCQSQPRPPDYGLLR